MVEEDERQKQLFKLFQILRGMEEDARSFASQQSKT